MSKNLNYRTNNALTQTFNTDNLNQLTTATRSGTLTVAGLASQPGANLSSVTVSGTGLTTGSATVYADGSWAKPSATLANGNNTYTATAVDTYSRTATDSLTVNLPATVTFQYDGNGNLTNDGRRVFEYDYENQLTNVYVASTWRSESKYDAFGRRKVRKDYGWSGSAWKLTNEVRYVYDGMLVVQERDTNNIALVSYTRGNDLSGSLQGAGGIGGLLARTENGRLAVGDASAHAYYHADGNGNITALVNTNGIMVARYNYDPYGNLLGMAGPLAEANTYRFSSKEYHGNAGLYYYGFRFYEPNLQRWLNRDPLGIYGGLNLYEFAGSNPMMWIDPYGLDWTDWIPDWIDPAANFCAGAGDDLTFGLTDMARESLGWNDQIDKDSRAYKGGETTAMAAGMITPTGFAKGVGKTALKQAEKKMTRRAAMRQAKRDAGIPTSQTHRTHRPVKTDRCGSKGTEYEFDGGRKIRNDFEGHKFKGGSTSPPHWNNDSTGNHYWY